VDSYIAAVESELERWPDVRHTIERRSKHRAVRLSLGRHERKIIIPTTGSDHRGPKNAVSQLRRTLKDMGATKLATKPTTKREAKEAAIVARVGVNNTSVIFSVPKTSPLYSRFVKDGESKFYWAFELRAVVDPKGVPHLAIVKKQPPAGGIKHIGVVRGSVNRQSATFSIAIFRNQFKAINKLGTFSSQPIELYADEGEVLLFKLPANRKPLTSKKPEPAAVEPKPEPEVTRAEASHPPAVSRKLEPEPVAAPAPAASSPTPLVIQAPKEPVSLEKAINVINAYKERMGDNLRLSIAEGGYLAVIAKMGRR
jgi:hypothetical protein